MKLCDVPEDFVLDLGYRKLQVRAGKRHYTDEVADAYPMSQYVVEEPAPDPEPEAEPKKGK